MWKTSLLFRLVTSSFLLSLATVSLMGALVYWEAKNALQQSVFDRLSLSAYLKANELHRWVLDQAQDVLCISKSAEITINGRTLLTRQPSDSEYQIAYQKLTAFLHNVTLTVRPDFREVLLMAPVGGKVLLSTDKSHEGQYRTQDTFYLEGRQGLFTQNVYPWPVTLKPTITIAVPLLDNGGQLLGVLAVHLNLKRMDDIVLADSGLGLTGRAYLVDSYNVLVSAERFGNPQYPRGIHSHGIDNALRQQNGQDLYLNHAGLPVVGVYRWLPDWKVALLTEISQDEAFKPAQSIALDIVFIGIVVTAVLVVMIYYLTRRIIQPIFLVTEATEQVARGNLNQRVPIITPDEIGQLARSFNLMTDHLQAALDRIQRSEEYYRLLIENVSDLISIVNRDGVITYASPTCLSELGYPPDQLIGKNMIEILHKDDYAWVYLLLSSNQEQPGVFAPFEVRLRHRERTYVDFEMTGTNCLANESINGIILAARNISVRKQAEQQIRELNTSLEQRVQERTAELERINKEMEAFSYTVSHDLRAPLRGLDGYSSLLLQDHADKLDGEAKSYLNNICQATRSMGQLIDDLLRLSRVTRQELRYTTVDLTAAATEIITRLRQQEPERPVECLVQPDLQVEGDPHLLKVVLENLLANAWKFTRHVSQARIECGALQETERLVYYVSDNGAGFNMAYTHKLFAPFQRLHRIEEFEGTGVGLATVRRIIERHGGDIWAKGEPGQGATFYFTLGQCVSAL